MQPGYISSRQQLPAMRAGDLLLNHNLTTFHSRGTWTDGETEEEKRHMLRIWLASPDGWWAPLPA